MDKYIKVVSQPYSGSTLLAFLLGNHPQIATVGELAGRTNYDGYRCSCGDLFIECPFWLNVASRMESKGFSIDLKNMNIRILGPTNITRLDILSNHYFPVKLLDRIRDLLFAFNKKRKEWVEDATKRNILLAETITEIYGKDHFFDSTQDLYRIRHLTREFKSRIKLIYLIRDGRGVFNSIIKRQRLSDRKAIDSWLWTHRMNNRVLKTYCSDEQTLYLKYEDLCRNLQDKLGEVFRFIGVSPEVNLKDFKTESFHIIGNVMRISFFGNILLDEKWKNELSPDKLAYFEKLAGKKNREFGYV